MSADEPTANSPADLGWTSDAVTRPPLRFAIPDQARASACRSCRASIYWVNTAAGRTMPVNADGTSHFGTCPKAAAHRKAKPPAARPLEAKELSVLRSVWKGHELSRRTDNLFALSALKSRGLIGENVMGGYMVTDAGIAELERLDERNKRGR